MRVVIEILRELFHEEHVGSGDADPRENIVSALAALYLDAARVL